MTPKLIAVALSISVSVGVTTAVILEAAVTHIRQRRIESDVVATVPMMPTPQSPTKTIKIKQKLLPIPNNPNQ